MGPRIRWPAGTVVPPGAPCCQAPPPPNGLGNQFRLFLHTGAYWLLHQLRQAVPRRSLWRKATFETIRRAFLKIAGRIEELKSRIRIALPSAYPYRPALLSMAGRIQAQGP